LIMDYLTLLGLLVGFGGVGTYERQFVGYNIKRGRDTGIYRQVYPLEIPAKVPSIGRIARRMFKHIDPKEFVFFQH